MMKLAKFQLHARQWHCSIELYWAAMVGVVHRRECAVSEGTSCETTVQVHKAAPGYRQPHTSQRPATFRGPGVKGMLAADFFVRCGRATDRHKQAQGQPRHDFACFVLFFFVWLVTLSFPVPRARSGREQALVIGRSLGNHFSAARPRT